MGTLTINGKKITVDDSFASLSPQQQEATVAEIASQMGSSPQAQEPPRPGSREYADWAAQQARAGQALPQVSGPEPVAAQPRSPSLYDASLATINGLTSSVPFLQESTDALIAGGQTAMDAVTGQPADFGKRYGDIRQSRERVAALAPLSNTLGQLGGVLGTAGVAGATTAGARMLGMSGPIKQQLANSIGSTALYEGISGLSKGHTGGELLADIGIGAGGGVAGPILGRAVEGTGQAVADSFTRGAQKKLTNVALERGGQSAATLRKEAGAYFGNSVDENPVILSGTSYNRLLNGIESATKRFRPNELNNPEAVGLLQKFWKVADEINAPGGNAVVDLKDLHILRQGARDVAEGSGSDQTKTIAKIVIRQTDDFIKSLKADDILGGADPTEAANNLMMGISTWSRASKVKAIEKAIADADTYKSGFENGLKLSFLKLMKTDDFARMTKVEQDAIRAVAKGGTVQNIAEGLGKLGFSMGGSSAHNIVGGSLGTTGLAAVLAPALGPLAIPAALVGTTAVGAGGRAVAESLGRGGAERAAQIAATQGIPIARQAPNMLAGARLPADLLARVGLGGAG